ncbi:MAG: hypothetical protein M3R68_06095 [Acidobacteriota bacterium]|nr:hypothetical protein [Acidobacteriota bacterium]
MKRQATASIKRVVIIALTLSLTSGQVNAMIRNGRSNGPTAAGYRNSQLSPEVTLSVNEDFLNAFLDSMFTNLKAPSAPLVITQSDKDRSAAESYGCPSAVTLEREEGGVKTAVKLEQGKISAPFAFAGKYNSTLLGCIEFHGWANTSWALEFDRTRQVLLARVQVQDIHLTNVPTLASGPLVKLVQSAIDARINPLELLKLDQLSFRVPVAPAGGALRMRAKEVSAEPVQGLIQLHIVFEFLSDR